MVIDITGVEKVGREPVKSAARALTIFEFFEQKRRALQLKEIINELGWPQSSTTVLLHSLTALGYLSFDRHKRVYFPTFRLRLLGDWLPPSIDPRLIDLMGELRAETGETVILAARNHLSIQYREVLDSSHDLRFHVVKGSMIPLTQTSLGWLVLSRLAPRNLEHTVRQVGIKIENKLSSKHISELVQNILRFSASDHCYVRDLPSVGGGCVAMMLPKSRDREDLVLGVGGVVNRLEPQMLDIVQSMRRVISLA